jgi:hypothetical protein
LPKIDLTQASSNDSVSHDPIPVGSYDVVVNSAEYTPGDKQHISIVFEVSGGDRKGAKVREWFYTHTEASKRISLEQLRSLGTSANFNPVNASQLIGKKGRIITELSQDGKFANVKRLLQTTVDAGTYNAVVDDVSRDSRNDKKFLRVSYKITDTGLFEGLLLTDNLYLHQAALGFTGSRLKKMGVSTDEFDTDNNSHIKSLIGNPVSVSTVPTISSTGNPFNRVTGVSVRGNNVSHPTAESIVIDTSTVAGLSSSEYQDFDEGLEDRF